MTIRLNIVNTTDCSNFPAFTSNTLPSCTTYSNPEPSGFTSSPTTPTTPPSEMEELIGSNHDVDFPVIGDAMGVQIKKPKALRKDSSRPSSPWPSDASPQHSSSSRPPSPEAETQSSDASAINSSRRKKKKSVGQHELLNFLKASEEATQWRHDEIMTQMIASQKTLDTLLQTVLEKQ